MKHILIDARLYGPKHTGIGRYTKNLLLHLIKTKQFRKNHFSLIINQSQIDEVKSDLGLHYQLIPTNIPVYSLKEQLLLPIIIKKHHPDLVHFTHFNKPILYFGLSVVTIHDLIKHFYKGKDTTTKNKFLYWLKYLFYLLVSFFSIKINHIIVPSNFWRQYILKKFNIKSSNIIITHEAVDPNFISGSNKANIAQNYIIYTGNLYPHKNFPVILKALKNLPDLKLKVICARDIFQHRAEDMAKKYQVSSQVEFLGYLKDKQFKKIYRHALALVHPSFMEGFSLTGLEAMSLNCPVISSTSSCLPEIYQDSVLYFDPNKANQLIDQIKTLQNNPKLRTALIKKGHIQAKKYSWQNTAKQTADFYQKVLHDRT